MCMQCVAKTDNFEKDPITGFFLCQATIDTPYPEGDTDHVKKGWWGFGVSNDPLFWFEHTPVPDPTFGMTEEQEKAFYEGKGDDEAFMEYMNELDEILYGNGLPPVVGYRMVKACIDLGWKEDEGGFVPFLAHNVWMASQSRRITHAEQEAAGAEGLRRFNEGIVDPPQEVPTPDKP